MHNEAYEIVCAGDPQAVIWLIIIAATVIVQIVKAGKRLTRTPPEPGPPGQEPVAPQDELREFLENLAGTRRAPPAQSPPRRATAPPAAKSARVRAGQSDSAALEVHRRGCRCACRAQPTARALACLARQVRRCPASMLPLRCGGPVAHS